MWGQVCLFLTKNDFLFLRREAHCGHKTFLTDNFVLSSGLVTQCHVEYISYNMLQG